jgi:hypothetical protein
MSDPGVYTGHNALSRHIKCSLNMIALCQRRERRSTRNTHSTENIHSAASGPVAPALPPSSKPERITPLTCHKYQCLFCLCSNLPQGDREKRYASKYCLQRHAERCRLRHFREQDQILCPDDLACGGMVFDGESHFQNHAASVHAFIL